MCLLRASPNRSHPGHRPHDPRSEGRSNYPSNLQVICRPCNQRKDCRPTRNSGRGTAASFRSVPLLRHGAASHSESLEKRLGVPVRVRASNSSDEPAYFKRNKVSSGCLILGVAVGVIVMFALASRGVEDTCSFCRRWLWEAAFCLGVWVRAYRTGAMIEDDE